MTHPYSGHNPIEEKVIKSIGNTSAYDLICSNEGFARWLDENYPDVSSTLKETRVDKISTEFSCQVKILYELYCEQRNSS